MRLKPLLFVAGTAGAVAVVLRRRGASGAPQAASSASVGERYQPPAEAGAQPPAQPSGAPSDATELVDAAPVASEPGDLLNEPEHAPPEGAVMPDMSTDDPLVRQQEAAARSDAGSIGGNVDELAAADASFPTDPATRPVIEGAGDENEETFETREGVERGNRETES